MATEALILLRETPEAQRLAVAWPKIPRDLRPVVDDKLRLVFLEAEDALDAMEFLEDLMERWSAASGVSMRDVERFGPSLIVAGICTVAGLDPEAAKYLRSIVAEDLARTAQKLGAGSKKARANKKETQH